MPKIASETLTIGQAAERLGVQVWRLRRLYERGLLPEPERVGHIRVVTEADLPELKRLLNEAGYVR